MNTFWIGLGVGIAAGMLLAPKSGEETRDFLGSKATDGVDYLKRQSQELKDSAVDAVDRGKDMVNKQVGKIAASQDDPAHIYQR